MIFLLRSDAVALFVEVAAVCDACCSAGLCFASLSAARTAASATFFGPSSRKAIAKARSPSILGSRTVSRFDLSSKSCRSSPLMSFGCCSDIVDIFYHRNHAFPMVLCGFVPFEVFCHA